MQTKNSYKSQPCAHYGGLWTDTQEVDQESVTGRAQCPEVRDVQRRARKNNQLLRDGKRETERWKDFSGSESETLLREGMGEV